jgi:rhodanese-related sulfurtransferase
VEGVASNSARVIIVIIDNSSMRRVAALTAVSRIIVNNISGASFAYVPSVLQQGRSSTLLFTSQHAATHFVSNCQLFVSSMSEQPKPGVSSPEELHAFVEQAGDRLVVIDVRNPNADIEPGDQKSLKVAPLPSADVRPAALHVVWDRDSNGMDLPAIEDKTTPIITHCGGGGRGQLAKEFLEQRGYTNVVNGGGPKEVACWKEYGDK